MKLDLLVFGAHPDDAEMTCGGTICKLVAEGKKVGIVDLTRGEMGTRGTPETRASEAADAARIMGISARENLAFRDGFFVNDEAHQLQIVRMLRKYRPELVLANAIRDRHPDHGKGAAVVRDAIFVSGLRKIETILDGVPQEPWRPRKLFHYIQDRFIHPDFIVDISGYFEQRKEAISAYRSQFYNPGSGGPETYISTKTFWDFLEARARDFGHMAGFAFGEGFTSENPPGLHSPFDIL
jgi:bacillithiol biosynthesis deacetylase BshB1